MNSFLCVPFFGKTVPRKPLILGRPLPKKLRKKAEITHRSDLQNIQGMILTPQTPYIGFPPGSTKHTRMPYPYCNSSRHKTIIAIILIVVEVQVEVEVEVEVVVVVAAAAAVVVVVVAEVVAIRRARRRRRS